MTIEGLSARRKQVRTRTLLRGALWIATMPLVFVGCRTTIVAKDTEWTAERAIALIEATERGYLDWVNANAKSGYLAPALVSCDETEFGHVHVSASQSVGYNLAQHTWQVQRFKFADISAVTTYVHPEMFLCFFMFPPWAAQTVYLEMKDGRELRLQAIDFVALQFIVWVYPYNLIHGYSQLGEAIDYMRRRAQGGIHDPGVKSAAGTGREEMP